MERPADGAGLPDGATLAPLLDLLVERIPAPSYDPEAPLQALVTNLDSSPYLGRVALCRVMNGHIRKGETVAWCRTDGTVERAKVTEQIGRASCRERVCQYVSIPVVGVSLKKKKSKNNN